METPDTLSDSLYLENRTGLVSSFDAWESVWEKAFATLQVRSDEPITTPHPILRAEDYLTGTNQYHYTDRDTRRQWKPCCRFCSKMGRSRRVYVTRSHVVSL